jgi:hypothetical protein
MKTTAKVTRWLLSQDTGSYSDPIAVKQVLSFEKKLGAAVTGKQKGCNNPCSSRTPENNNVSRAN